MPSTIIGTNKRGQNITYSWQSKAITIEEILELRANGLLGYQDFWLIHMKFRESPKRPMPSIYGPCKYEQFKGDLMVFRKGHHVFKHPHTLAFISYQDAKNYLTLEDRLGIVNYGT